MKIVGKLEKREVKSKPIVAHRSEPDNSLCKTVFETCNSYGELNGIRRSFKKSIRN